MRKYKFLFIILILFISIDTAKSTTYYVNNSWVGASDTNDGLADSNTQSWLTVNKCATTLIAGDVCSIIGGTNYNEQSILFTNSGTSGLEIQFVGSNTPVINGSDTIININKNFINLTNITIQSITSKSWGTDNSTLVPIINVTGVNNITLNSINITQLNYSGFSVTNPEQGGRTPNIRIYSSPNFTMYSSYLYNINPVSSSIYIYNLSKPNFTDNRLFSIQYETIDLKDPATNSNDKNNINGLIWQNNTDFRGKQILFYTDNSSGINITGGDYGGIYFLNVSNATIQDLTLNTSDGINLYSVNNTTISNYTYLKSRTSKSEGVYSGLTKAILVPGIYLFNTTWSNITNYNISNGGRHSHGLRYRYANNNSVTGYTANFTAQYDVTGDGASFGTDGHNDFWNYYASGYNIIRNMTGKDGTRANDNVQVATSTWNIWDNLTITDISPFTEGIWTYGSSAGNNDLIKNATINIGAKANYHIIQSGSGTNITVQDSYFNTSRANTVDFRLVSGANSIFLDNVTYNDTAIAAGTITVKWFLDVGVQNSTSALQNAWVNVTNNSGSSIFNLQTNTNGNITQQKLIQYTENSTGRYYSSYVNYTINTSLNGYITDSSNFNISSNRLETVVLSSTQINDNDANLFWVNISQGSDLCDGQGDNSDNGTHLNCAWATVNKSGVAQAGQSVEIISGVYDNDILTVNNSGTINSGITYHANGTVNLSGVTQDIIILTNRQYIDINGLFSINGGNNGIYGSNSSYININNTEIYNMTNDAISFNNGSNNITINNVRIDNITEHGILFYGLVNTQKNINILNSSINNTRHNGIDLHTNIQDALVENNTLSYIQNSYGVFSHNSNNTRIRIRNNTYNHNNRSVGLLGTNDTTIENEVYNDSHNTYAIYLGSDDSYGGLNNVTLTNNTATNSVSRDILVYSDALTYLISNITFVSNNFTHATQTYYFYNNTENIKNIIIRNPKENSMLKYDGNIINSTLEYTTYDVFASTLSTSPKYYHDKSNISINGVTGAFSITKYPITIQTSSSNVTATNTTSVLIIDYQNKAIPRINFSFGTGIGLMNVTLSNVTSGANYSLYYSNNTHINSTIAQSPVYFNLSLGNDEYYINETLPASSGTSGPENINSTVTRYTIYWQWSNPTEATYNTTRIYINGEFIANQTATNYLLQNLQPQSVHTLSLRSVNTTGENTTWVNSTATTLTPDTGGGSGGGGGGGAYIYTPKETNETNISNPIVTQTEIIAKQQPQVQLSDVSKRQLLFGSAIALLLFSIFIFIKPRR